MAQVPGRKAAGMASSNSPKNVVSSNNNKLFLKGFRDEH
jgi:hypothetical protein